MFGYKTPVASAMLSNVGRELVVFLRRPLTPFDVVFLAAWNSSHLRRLHSVSYQQQQNGEKASGAVAVAQVREMGRWIGRIG